MRGSRALRAQTNVDVHGLGRLALDPSEQAAWDLQQRE